MGCAPMSGCCRHRHVLGKFSVSAQCGMAHARVAPWRRGAALCTLDAPCFTGRNCAPVIWLVMECGVGKGVAQAMPAPRAAGPMHTQCALSAHSVHTQCGVDQCGVDLAVSLAGYSSPRVEPRWHGRTTAAEWWETGFSSSLDRRGG